MFSLMRDGIAGRRQFGSNRLEIPTRSASEAILSELVSSLAPRVGVANQNSAVQIEQTEEDWLSVSEALETLDAEARASTGGEG